MEVGAQGFSGTCCLRCSDTHMHMEAQPDIFAPWAVATHRAALTAELQAAALQPAAATAIFVSLPPSRMVLGAPVPVTSPDLYYCYCIYGQGKGKNS